LFLFKENKINKIKGNTSSKPWFNGIYYYSMMLMSSWKLFPMV